MAPEKERGKSPEKWTYAHLNKMKGIPTSKKDEASLGTQHLKLPVALVRRTGVDINAANDLYIDQPHMTSVGPGLLLIVSAWSCRRRRVIRRPRCNTIDGTRPGSDVAPCPRPCRGGWLFSPAKSQSDTRVWTPIIVLEPDQTIREEEKFAGDGTSSCGIVEHPEGFTLDQGAPW